MGSENKKDKAGRIDERDARNRELIRRYREEGDREALALLLEENDGLLRKAVNRLKGFREMEEDLLQEARLEMATKMVKDFDLQQDKVKFSTYASDRAFWKMFEIADKASNSQLRKSTKKRQEEETEEKSGKVIVSLDESIGEDGETLLDLISIDANSISAKKGGNPENTVLRREYHAELEIFINNGFLTAGEQAVMRGIVRGEENKEIGARLHRRAWEIEKMKKRALEKTMYAAEREELFPEYTVRHTFGQSPENDSDTEYKAALEEFLTDSGFLTAGEQAVMRGIAKGEGYDEIGVRLHRKTREIEKMEKRALEKMRYVREREELFPVFVSRQAAKPSAENKGGE